MTARTWLRVLSMAFAFGLTLGAAAPADADLHFYSYTKSAASGGVDKDPINVLYVDGGTLSVALSHFADHVGWSDDGGSDQYFIDHNVGQTQQAQKADQCGWCTNRNHTRFNQQDDTGPSGYGTFTMGAAHYEENQWCGPLWVHVSTSFNDARGRIRTAMASAHSWNWLYWGNTNSIQQCNGSWVASDGYMARISVP